MTLIVAVGCRNGLILASDGQATVATSGQPTKQPVTKLYSAWDNLAWGASGSPGIAQHVEMALGKAFSQANRFARKNRAEIRHEIRDCVIRTIRPIFKDQVMQLPGMSLPLTSFLFVVWATDGPLILDIAANLDDQDHATVGYDAIGSGEIFPYFALTSISHYGVRNRSCDEVKMIAYRIVDDAIKVAAQGLGPPIQMIEIVSDENATRKHVLQTEEIQILADKVTEWKTVEAESLETVVGVGRAQGDVDGGAPAEGGGEARPPDARAARGSGDE